MINVDLIWDADKQGYPCPACEDVFFAPKATDVSEHLMLAIHTHFQIFHDDYIGEQNG